MLQKEHSILEGALVLHYRDINSLLALAVSCTGHYQPTSAWIQRGWMIGIASLVFLDDKAVSYDVMEALLLLSEGDHNESDKKYHS